MAGRASTTAAQDWCRNLAEGLELSFRGSAAIAHNVTKGDSREHQVLDVLEAILPTKISVGRNVTIADSAGIQSPKFDGVLIDRSAWPLLYSQDRTTIAMIESIVAAFETKSALTRATIRDIFSKTAALRAMNCNVLRPKVTAFAYRCPNRNLSFFDYATSAGDLPAGAVPLVCILNSSVFGMVNPVSHAGLSQRELAEGIPVLLRSGKDSLLLYIFILSSWSSLDASYATLFRAYNESLFAEAKGFFFGEDFLEAIRSDADARSSARQCFVGKARSDIKSIYRKARSEIGLS